MLYIDIFEVENQVFLMLSTYIPKNMLQMFGTVTQCNDMCNAISNFNEFI